MRTKGQDWKVARQIAFFAPADMKGKWHAGWKVDHTTVCGKPVTLGTEAIRTSQGQDASAVHPIVCRTCLRLSTSPGLTGAGMEG